MLSVGLLSGGYGAQVRAAIALLTWWAVMLVIVLGGRPHTRLPRTGLVATGSLVALGILATLSLSWSGDDGRTFTEVVRIAGYAGLLALVLLLSPAGSGRAWLTGVAAGLVGIACLALGSRLLPSAFSEPELIRVSPGVQNRLSYPIGYWNGLGTCMAMALVLLAWLQASARSRGARTVAAALILVPALTLLFTSSRGGVAALAAGLIALVAIERHRSRLLVGALPAIAGCGVAVLLALQRDELLNGPVRGHEATTQGRTLLVFTLVLIALMAIGRYLIDPFAEHVQASTRVGTGLVAAACVVALAVAAIGDLPGRIADFNNPPPPRPPRSVELLRHLGSAGGQGRYQLWQSALKAFRHEPVRGIGAGGYEAWWTEKGSIFHPARDAHSLYLETLAELGILGGLCLAWFLAAIAAGALKAVRRSETAVALAVVVAGALSAAVDWIWELPAAFGCVVIAAALLTGRALREPAAAVRPSTVRVALGVAVAAAGIVVGTLGYAGEAELADSRDAASNGHLDQAAADARYAHAALPWSGAPWLQLALVEESHDLGRALTAVNRAVEDAPDDWRAWVVAARIRTKAGDVAGGARALRRARELNPRTELLKD